jgi:S-adenosylmethionine:tRNA ribosyltransferase-isomerase
VETEHVEEHAMHPEWCWLPAETGRAIRRAKAEGGRVVAVGTTSARTIESFTAGELEEGGTWETRLLIMPGYRWKHVDVLMTNFHLPRSTLMAMVAAFLGEDEGAVTRLKDLYAGAMKEGYRFYSYGDAMIVLP